MAGGTIAFKGDPERMGVAILGLAAYATNAAWRNVEILVRSARRNSPAASIVLLTAPLGELDRRLFRRFGVRAIEAVDEVPPSGPSPEARAARQRWILEMFGRRHSMYSDAIASLPHSHFLLADTRDVVVTGELGDKASKDHLVLSQEDCGTPISADPYNSRWIADGYGDAELTRLGNSPILCAGVVFGPRSCILDYVRAMNNEVRRLGVEMTRRIGDQPLHNHLAYAGLLPRFEVSRAEDGWLRSIGLQAREQVRLDWARPCHSGDGAERPLVVHQYDRHLGCRNFRRAVGRVSGLASLSRWRLEAYHDHGKDLGARILRRLALHTDFGTWKSKS